MTSCVLVPGACHGGWWYDELAEAAAPVVLVGHSYAGTVITGVAGRMPERVRALVYLDAFLPGDGESCWAMTNDEQRAGYADGARRTGYGIDPLPFFSVRARPGLPPYSGSVSH